MKFLTWMNSKNFSISNELPFSLFKFFNSEKATTQEHPVPLLDRFIPHDPTKPTLVTSILWHGPTVACLAAGTWPTGCLWQTNLRPQWSMRWMNPCRRSSDDETCVTCVYGFFDFQGVRSCQLIASVLWLALPTSRNSLVWLQSYSRTEKRYTVLNGMQIHFPLSSGSP